MSEKQKFYITTAISYVNGKPHLGHAYEVISVDVIARFMRLAGYDVHFLTGTDEHGQKVEKTAADAGMAPRQFCDSIAANFQTMIKNLNIANDDFIRTTESRHKTASQAFWQKLAANNDIYLGSYSGWYSIRDEAFFAEKELTISPDGRRLAPGGAEVEWIEEPSYFFRLSNYTDKLLALYAEQPDFIQPDYRRNEVINFVEQGLNDLSISRTSFKWGIPVPNDDKHIMYVWLDALANYLTALGYPDTDMPLFTKYWPANIHVIGKDILRFHAVYWPAFLMSAGMALPKKVFGHGFLTIEGQKMSKSLGNVVAPQDLVDEFGLDQTRYFLMREVPFGQDGSFSRNSMIQRINGDLANDIGNLVQRILAMIAKNCGGQIPNPAPLRKDDLAIMDTAKQANDKMRQAMDDIAIHKMLEYIWQVVGEANRYIDTQAPWQLKKQDPERMATVLYVGADVIRILGLYLQSIMPESARKVLDLLNVDQSARDFNHIDQALEPGKKLPPPVAVFPRFVEQTKDRS